MRPIRSGTFVAVAAVLTACDAGRRVVVDVTMLAAPTEISPAGGTVRVFALDGTDDLAAQPMDELVAHVGRDRRSGRSWGMRQTDWEAAPIDDDGRAQIVLQTFYAGAAFLPVQELLRGKREEHPEGLALEVILNGTPPRRFVVGTRDRGSNPLPGRDCGPRVALA